MIVSHIMTKNPAFVHPDMPLHDAGVLMKKHQISKLPV
jgi:CBS domain-containing protein